MILEGLKSISNLLIRVVNLGLRFFLIFLLAKYLTIQEFTQYGIIVATIAYGIYFIGFEFYLHTTREIINTEKKNKGFLIKNHTAFLMTSYLLSLPIFGLLFYFELLDPTYLLLLSLLLIFDHLNEEIYRLLVVEGKPLIANLLYSIRNAVWISLLLVLIFLNKVALSLDFVLKLWLIFVMSAFIIGIAIIWTFKFEGWQERISFRWIVTGMKICLPLFIVSLAIRFITVSDKYVLDTLFSQEVLAPYLFFFSIASSLNLFLESGVFNLYYPKLIYYRTQSDRVNFLKTVRLLVTISSIFIIGFVVLALVTIKWLVDLVGFGQYLSNLKVFYILLGYVVLFSLSNILHYILFAFRAYGEILKSHVACLLFFIVSLPILISLIGSNAVSIVLILSMLFLLCLKVHYCFKCLPSDWNILSFKRKL